MIKLTYIKSEERAYNIERCLSLMKGEIKATIEAATNIVVKVDCTSSRAKETATHKDALEALLQFIKPYAKNQIIVAGRCATSDTLDAFKNFGYLSLQEKYDFSITDLNDDDAEEIQLLDKNGIERKAKIPKTIINSDYLISISLPKTDGVTVYSGVIENVAPETVLSQNQGLSSKIAARIGFIRTDKVPTNQNKIIHQNITRLYQKMPVKLSILDGYQVMEGDGPQSGNLVPLHWAIASANPVATDCLACTLLGINYQNVGYLAMLEEGKDEYFIAGDDWQRNIKKIKMHSDFDKAKNWQ